MWWVPVLVFVLAFAAGAAAASRWLPDLAPGRLGGLAFFLVCGLSGAALGVAGMRIYLLVRELEIGAPEIGGRGFKAVSIANGLETLLFETGLLAGVAAGVYLLAPRVRAGEGAPPPPDPR